MDVSKVLEVHFRLALSLSLNPPAIRTTEEGEALASVFRSGDIYYLSTAIAESVKVASPGLPGDAVLSPEHLLSDCGVMYVQDGVELDYGKEMISGPDQVPTNKLFILAWVRQRYTEAPEHPGRVCFWGIHAENSMDDGVLGFQTLTWEFGTPIVDPKDRLKYESTYEFIRWILGTLIFLQQKIIIPQEKRLDRGSRRRFEKSFRIEPPPVQVITLRAVDHSRKSEDCGETQTQTRHVDWGCSWLVRGHWRRYGTGRTIWVNPYRKGPEDKPFRARPTIFAGIR